MPETSFSSRFQWFHSVFGYCLPLTFGSAKVGATGRSRGTSEPQALDVAQSYCLTAGNDEGTWRASKMFLIKHVHRSGNQHLKFCLKMMRCVSKFEALDIKACWHARESHLQNTSTLCASIPIYLIPESKHVDKWIAGNVNIEDNSCLYPPLHAGHVYPKSVL